MRGYWNEPDKTSGAIDQALWMHTGDLATMDEDGYVRIVGRIRDIVIRGGENIYPREIEEFLYGHPSISDVQVIGVPDEQYGEQLMAWIVIKDGETLSAEDVRAFAHDQIAHFKIPHYIKFVDEFPLTVTGKIQKFKMREQAIEELGLQHAAADGYGLAHPVPDRPTTYGLARSASTALRAACAARRGPAASSSACIARIRRRISSAAACCCSGVGSSDCSNLTGLP